MTSCRNSTFEDITIKGTWSTGTVVTATQVGVLLNSLSTAVSSNNNTFTNCTIEDTHMVCLVILILKKIRLVIQHLKL